MQPLKIILFLAFCFSIMGSSCTPKPPPASADFSEIDKFQKELAKRASTALGTAEDFNIVVTQAYYPIGTLLRVQSTIPIDYTACRPKEEAFAAQTPSLFPTYKISKGLAIDFGLDNEVIKNLVDFKVKISDADTIDLAVKLPKIQTLSDNNLRQILRTETCKNAIESTAWLVRGYILGQRNFTLKNAQNNSVGGKIEKIASFNISSGPSSASIDMTDEKEIGFLQIVSQVMITPTPASAPTIATPKTTTTLGLVYIQQDKNDTTKKSDSVASSLKTASFNVANAIEKIESSGMPTLAQVRYFNETDKENAQKALIELQKIFPNAILRRIGLPAPSGQLEVWLPKVTS